MTAGKKFIGNNLWKKKELEKKHIQKLATLKKYAKLAKAEGIQSDRIRNPGSERREPKAHTPNKPKKHPVKAAQPQVNKLEEHVKVKEDLSEKVSQIEESVKKRKQLKRELTMKTKKGQPVMKGRIKNILSKLMTGN